jgi:hypothetical protein
VFGNRLFGAGIMAYLGQLLALAPRPLNPLPRRLLVGRVDAPRLGADRLKGARPLY